MCHYVGIYLYYAPKIFYNYIKPLILGAFYFQQKKWRFFSLFVLKNYKIRKNLYFIEGFSH